MLWCEYPGAPERFDSKVDRSGACHVWKAATLPPSGYGRFRLSYPERRNEYAHRLSLERKLGRELRPGERALHSCDNPPCVNPDHLRPGDQFDNMADSLARGRFAIGEGKPKSSRLKEVQVREILALSTVDGLTHQAIADRYLISRTQVTNIINGKAWKHITTDTEKIQKQ